MLPGKACGYERASGSWVGTIEGATSVSGPCLEPEELKFTQGWGGVDLQGSTAAAGYGTASALHHSSLSMCVPLLLPRRAAQSWDLIILCGLASVPNPELDLPAKVTGLSFAGVLENFSSSCSHTPSLCVTLPPTPL